MTRPEGLFLGEFTDPANHERNGSTVGLAANDFTTHGVIVGMTGSGKTGLGMVLLEEMLTKNIPTLILDPKGDMGNLLLTFPNLSADEFSPWVPPGQDGAAVATTWTEGLAGWGLAGTDVATVRNGHPMTVYTPGSTAGIPLNIVGSLAPPTGADPETIRDEVESFTQGLLNLVGVQSDPLSGREHVLIANLIETAWAAGETLDLATLLIRIQDPPMRKLGVIDIDTFFPKKDRTQLVLTLNGLIASPSFAAWGAGPAIDIEQMLWTPEGTAKAALVYLAHLSDEERQMVVTRVLSKLVAWMRSQPGSTDLRVLVYMDEVYGFVPPSAAPPAKKPILTLFKQARAFGVGMVLATQNPVDLDYKAISNAGTWMIGRLQTERDKGRLLEGMTSASGSVDIAATDATISGLAKREFLLHTAGGKHETFAVRWAMSYLCGPLSKDQVPKLPGMAEEIAALANAAPAATQSLTEAPPTTAAADETPAMPQVAEGVLVRFVDAAAPWLSAIGGTAGGRRLIPGLAVRAQLTFDETKADLRHIEEFEMVMYPLTETTTLNDARAVDYDERDLVETQPTNTVFALPTAKIGTKSFFSSIETAVRDRLVAERSLTVFMNRELKLFGRPGESREEFASRCQAAAATQADQEANAIREKLSARIDRLRDQAEAAAQKADQLKGEANMSRTSEAISMGGSVLGALLGGRKSVGSIVGAVNRAATGRGRTQRVSNRVESALARAEEKAANLEDLENQLTEDLQDIVDNWNEVAANIETLPVPLEKSDVAIQQTALIWVPTN